MIRVTMVTGPHAGQTRGIPADIDPTDFLQSCVGHGYWWEIDYSQATQEEILAWGVANTAVRCLRALRAGRPVEFRDKIYTADPNDPEDIIKVALELEDAIVELGDRICFTIAQDDEYGILIDVVIPE